MEFGRPAKTCVRRERSEFRQRIGRLNMLRSVRRVITVRALSSANVDAPPSMPETEEGLL